MREAKTPPLYSVGVMLDDTRNPPRMYELDTIWPDGEGTFVLLGGHPRMYTRHAPISLFWPLIDSLP